MEVLILVIILTRVIPIIFSILSYIFKPIFKVIMFCLNPFIVIFVYLLIGSFRVINILLGIGGTSGMCYPFSNESKDGSSCSSFDYKGYCDCDKGYAD